MKRLTPIILVAIIANLITVCFYFYAASQPGGSGLTLAFVLALPVIWGVTLITAVTLTVVGRKMIFKKGILRWTIPALVFSTPIPFLVLFFILNPPWALQMEESGYYPKGDYTIKDEEWEYPGGHMAVHKYFIINSNQTDNTPDEDLMKDSVWVYFNKSGDTSKTEWYANGKLIKTVNKERRRKE